MLELTPCQKLGDAIILSLRLDDSKSVTIQNSFG